MHEADVGYRDPYEKEGSEGEDLELEEDVGAQPEIRTAMCSKDIIATVDDTIGRWFYDASIPFNTANSFNFQPIADAIASVGRGTRFHVQTNHMLINGHLQLVGERIGKRVVMIAFLSNSVECP
ncbi:hypothetical protein EJ110_NYTH05755 [Nymphaea thermarum]|nr:hypothetical protein EJ110_NYTH05755 [Nymphaea thermarum]